MKNILINLCLIVFSVSFAQSQTFNLNHIKTSVKEGKSLKAAVTEDKTYVSPGAKATTTATNNMLAVGKKMITGDRIWSPSKNHFAIMQPDGNLCVYTSAKGWLWCSNTQKAGSYLLLQPDGNMCVYTKDDNWVWDTRTHTAQEKPVGLTLDDNGTLHLKDKNGKSVWKNR